jgi:hypothetical protein
VILEVVVAGHVPKRLVCSELIPTMREYPPPPLLGCDACCLHPLGD